MIRRKSRVCMYVYNNIYLFFYDHNRTTILLGAVILKTAYLNVLVGEYGRSGDGSTWLCSLCTGLI